MKISDFLPSSTAAVLNGVSLMRLVLQLVSSSTPLPHLPLSTSDSLMLSSAKLAKVPPCASWTA